MEAAKYNELAEKLLNGTITPTEKQELFDWYNAGQDQPLIIPASYTHNLDAVKDNMLQQILQSNTTVKRRGLLYRLRKYRVAAAAVLLLATGTWLWYQSQPGKQTDAGNSPLAVTPKNTIQPGGNKAVLTLADGSTVVLDDAANGSIGHQGNAEIVKQAEGKLAYKNADAIPAITAMNTLSTPRGGQYQLALPDGSKVWLNAASSIRFPVAFTGNERVVELTGEAYFEVAKNKQMPFKVKVKDMEVQVLGTHFNVMAYEDERSLQTTLLEGSVKVTSPNAGKLLQPGEQAKYANGNMQVVDANVEDVVAWKNGMFQFNSLDVESVSRQLSRWYDVDIDIRDRIDEHFTGTISRSSDITKVLKMLQATGALSYKIENKKIIITQ
jgi:transmembrane sensor